MLEERCRKCRVEALEQHGGAGVVVGEREGGDLKQVFVRSCASGPRDSY